MNNKITNIRDPIHGFISLNELEKSIVQEPYFQRLRFIHQLGSTNWVYPGAVHSRFEHSLGVFHLACVVVDMIKKYQYLRITDSDEEIFRLASLLHDIGHGPFSHVGEEAGIFKAGLNHEKMGERIIEETKIGKLISKELGDDSINRLTSIIGIKDRLPTSKADHVFHELLAGQIGIDRMDYLLRDSHFLGVRYGNFDLNRILETLRYSDSDRLYWEEGGIHALEQFILARYFMFKDVYYHKTRRVLDYHLGKLIKDYLSEQGEEFLPDSTSKYMDINDNILLSHMMKSKKWKKIFLDRNFLKVKKESPEHIETEEELILWTELEKSLKEHFSCDNVYFDKAKNDPYKFETTEEVRVYYDKKIMALPEASLLVRSLKPINKMRIYVGYGKIKEVKKFVDDFLKTKMEG